MTTREDILERLAYADALGHGPQTSALIAEAVSWADALGDEDLRIATRLALTEAYQQGNEAWKALAPFSWNLGRYQRRPEAFDDAQVRTLHWHFKWAVAVAGANPRVSKDKVRQLEASLEEFSRSGGASMHVVHGERASVAGLLGLEEEAAEEHQRFLAWEEEMLAKVELPYRVIDTAAGDLGTSAARKFDCEAWLPTQERYMEVTSTSNCTTFQARRLGIRERREDGMAAVAPLNGTLATTRWIVAFLENHQQADGSIYVPEALRPYLGGLEVLSPVAR